MIFISQMMSCMMVGNYLFELNKWYYSSIKYQRKEAVDD